MHHVDEQSIELDSIIEIQKNILGSDVDSSCIAGLSANIWNYIILNLCYQALLPALTCSSEAISKSALIDVKHFQRTVSVFFWGAVSTTILGCSTTIQGRSTTILGRSTVCPWFVHGHVFRTKKGQQKHIRIFVDPHIITLLVSFSIEDQWRNWASVIMVNLIEFTLLAFDMP